MKFLIWAVAILLTGLWTLCAAALAGLASWLASHGADAFKNISQGADVALPAWLTLWIPAVWLEPLRQGSAALLGGMVEVLPWLAAMVGWLAPLVWVIWFFGALLLLAVAIGLHWWLSSRRQAVRLR